MRLLFKLILIGVIIFNMANTSDALASSPILKVGFMSSIKRVDNQVYVGPLPDIMREVVELTDYSLALQAMPIKRLLKSLKSGEVDAVIGLFKREERLNYSHYLDQPIGWVCTNLFKLKSNSLITKDISSLNNKQIGFLRGASIGNELAGVLNEQHTIKKYMTNYKVLVNTLKLGRFDAVIASSEAFNSAAKKQGAQEIFDAYPLKEVPNLGIYILVSKNSQYATHGDIFTVLNNALKTLNINNRLRLIYQRNGKTFDEHCK